MLPYIMPYILPTSAILRSDIVWLDTLVQHLKRIIRFVFMYKVFNQTQKKWRTKIHLHRMRAWTSMTKGQVQQDGVVLNEKWREQHIVKEYIWSYTFV